MPDFSRNRWVLCAMRVMDEAEVPQGLEEALSVVVPV